jgi:predicted Zn-dependent protease
MPRTPAFPLFALALVSLAVGCGRSDRPQTTSASAGATPSVSATATDSSETGTAGARATPVTYETAESAFTGTRYPEATQLFTAYTGDNPENPWGYYMLGMSAWKSGEPKQAVSAFDRALELDPNHRKSLFNSSRVLLEIGRPQDALERIEKALSQEPMSNEGLRLLARARYQLGNVDGAIEAYHRALAVDETDVWSMNNLGLIYIDQNRSSEALPPLAHAVELRSTAPVFQNNLGTALERSGYPVEAAKAYEAAIALDSTYQKASVSLARVTGVDQAAESEPVDLGALSQQFKAEIGGWQGTVSDSSSAEITGLSDSTVASVEAVSDSVEDCQPEELK